MSGLKKILIIKHGALGDFIASLGAFDVIRRNHENDHLTLLTTSSFVNFAKETSYFDDVLIDQRDRFYMSFFKMRQQLKNFDRVYDLQTSTRTKNYYHLLKPGKRPEWCGHVPGCTFPQTRPDRNSLHNSVRLADQLRVAGLDLFGQEVLYPDFSWLKVDVSRFNLPNNGIVLIPGSSKNGIQKRWPAEYYGALANKIFAKNYTPILVAGPDDHEAVEVIKGICPQIMDLSMKLSLFEIAGVARQARMVVGNDTGPIHVTAAAKAPTLILWSKAFDQNLFAPRGEHVRILYEAELNNLHVDAVARKMFEEILVR